MNPFGDAPANAAPSQPQATSNPFGDPLASAGSQAFDSSNPVISQAAEGYVRQKWEQLGHAALQSQGQKIVSSADEAYRQSNPGETRLVTEASEKTLPNAIAYLQGSIPPEQRKATEDKWRQEYSTNALNVALAGQQAGQAGKTPEQVGKLQATLVNAPIRGATKTVTEPVKGGANLILGTVEQGVEAGYQNGEGADPNAGTSSAAIARQATANTLNKITGNVEKSFPQSTVAQNSHFGLNTGTAQKLIESGAEMIPPLIMMGRAFQAGGVDKALAFGQMGAQGFEAGYERTYNSARAQGMNEADANSVALAGGAIDGVVNTYLMKFGAIGSAATKQPAIRAAMTMAVKDAFAQGAVGAGQGLTSEASKYLLTGESPSLEAILHQAAVNAVGGLGSGGVRGLAEGRAPVAENTKAPEVSAPQAKPSEVPAPTAETMKPLLTAPAPEPKTSLVDKAVPKYRVQEGAESKGLVLDFENRDDKLHYAATQPRLGKVGKEAINELKSRGLTDDQIESYGSELRDRVSKLAKGSAGDTVKVPSITPPAAAVAGVGTPAEQGQSGSVPVRSMQPAEVANAQVKAEAPVAPAGGPGDAANVVRVPEGRQTGLPGGTPEVPQSGAGKVVLPEGTVSKPVPSESVRAVPEVAKAESDLPNIRPEAKLAKPSKYVRAASNAVEKVLGIKVVHINDSGGAAGFIHPDHPGVAFIDARYPVKGWVSVLGHEWMHTVQDSDPAAAKAFLEAIPQEQRTKYMDTYKAKLAKMRGIDTSKYLTPEVSEREIGAMALQDAATRSVIRRALMGQKAGVWEKIVETGQGIWDKLTGKHQIVDKALALLRDKAVKPEEANVSEVPSKNGDRGVRILGRNPEATSGGSEAAVPKTEAAGPPAKVRATRRPREVETQGTLFAPKGNDRIRKEAEEYTKANGVPYHPDSSYAEVNVERAKRIASAYDLSTHSPNDPKVKASYEAFKKETLDQWKYLESKGVKFEAWNQEGQPYKNSEEMRNDVAEHKHLYFYQGGDLPTDHPLAEKAPGTPYTYNDVFRAVHDYFGHTKEGVGFGPRGEENAWRSHSVMYSEQARGAMTTETRGQNSWVNFGPQGEHNQANPTDTRYAEQKATLLPDEFHKVEQANGASFAPKGEKELMKHLTPEERESLTDSEAKRALDVFRTLPADAEFEAAAQAGIAKKGWYEKASAALIDLFGPDSRQFAALLAADSPRQTVEKNFRETIKVWKAWDDAGRPTDPVKIEALLGGIMETRKPNLIRALRGEQFSGPKVSNFTENVRGNLQAVTNDAWMAKFGDVDQKVFSDNGGYLGYTAKVRRVAKSMGLEPAQVQETIWSFFKTLSERINKETTGHEALKNLTHEDVAEAPAFHDMLGDPDVRAALRGLGLSEESIRSAEGAAKEAGSGEEPPSGYVAEGRKEVLNRIAQRAEKFAKHQPSEITKAQRTLFYPGEKFIDEDVKPRLEEAGKSLKAAWTGVKSILGPQVRSDEARYAGNTIRERGAELAQRSDRLNEAFRDSMKAFEKLDVPITRDFIDKMERGLRQTDPALQPAADALRAILNDRLAQVQALGTGKLANFIEDYFPHLWKDPVKAKSVYGEAIAKAPLEGKKGFLKQRTLKLFSDGIKKGLEPVTENPVEAVLLRVREMDKYITIHQAFQEMGMKGVLTRVSARGGLPEGYAKINDNIATVYAKASRRGAIQIKGYIVAPEAVANVINNYLSPGIRGDKNFGGLFRAYLGAGNVMNQVQLGMSGFHLLNTTLDSATSKLALSFKQLGSGQFKEAGKSVVNAATMIGPAIGNIHKGNLILREWVKPGSTTPEIAQIVDAMKAAGGRIKMDDFYHTGMTDKMMEAYKKGNYIGAALRLPFAGIEQSAKPIMEMIVPRMKMGVFHDMARYELSKMPAGAGREEVRAAMAKAWDSVDNRMGELVYDNLFWNKAAKDLAMASTRSVGWNLGTLRELAGGVVDLGTMVKRAAIDRSFGNTEFTHRMAYATAMPIMAGLVGGMVHYALGNGVPKEAKDWFFPKTGEKDKEGHDIRLALPSYMKDVLAYGKDPAKTLSNKVHPMLNTIMEMMANKDYYGTKIRNEDDPFMKQLLDEAKFVGEQFTPFGVREVKKLHDEGQGVRSLLPLVGIVQARSDITHTSAELKAQEIMQERQPHGTRTREEADHSKKVRDLANALKAKEPNARENIREAMQSGDFTEADIQNIRSRQKFSGMLERSVKSMEFDDAMKVWEVMDDGEKRRLGPQMFAKLRSSKSLKREDRVAYMKRLQTDWARIKAGTVPQGDEE